MPSWGELEERLLIIVRPPPPPWLIERWREEAEAKRIALGLPPPLGRRRGKRPIRGNKWVGTYLIEWEESTEGRGIVKVLRGGDRTVGRVSYLSSGERVHLVELLSEVIRRG